MSSKLRKTPLTWSTWITFSLSVACVVATSSASQLLLPRGSVWHYWDAATPPQLGWETPGFSDAVWAFGPAPLGYGDGDEATQLDPGPNPSSKPITTWFRRTFLATNTAGIEELTATMQCDDGAVVYLNGTELFRRNLPAGAISPNTLALNPVAGAAEDAYVITTLATTSSLIEGTNLLAVELHQVDPSSSDISFDLELTAPLPPLELITTTSFETNQAPILNVALADEPEQGVTVSFYGRIAGAPIGPDFTLVALPDTQYYVSERFGGSPSLMVAQMEWILANREQENIAFVTQLGDCVENGDNGGDDIEWRHATNAFYRLEDPFLSGMEHGLPYGIAVGNHDQSPFGSPSGSTMFYNTYFGAAHFAPCDYYGGHYGTNNNNHFELFNASGLDFIILHLEFDPAADTNVLQWADALLKAYPNHRAILVSHYLIEQGNPGQFGPQGRAIYDALKNNPNLFLMLSGHVPGEGRRTDVHEGNTVHTLLSDYQGRANGGDGWLRLLQFSPSNNVVRVRTYSPTLGQYETDADSEFELECNLQRGEAYSFLGTVELSGNQASLLWPELDPGTDYEWYATATDGERAGGSLVERFQTEALGSGGDAQTFLIAEYRLVGEMLELTWRTLPGHGYRVYTSEACRGAEWIQHSSDLASTNSTMTYAIPTNELGSARFFRVEEVK